MEGRELTYDGEEKKKGVSEAASVDSRAVNTSLADLSICGPISDMLPDPSCTTHLAHTERLIDSLLILPPLTRFPLPPSIAPNVQHRSLLLPLLLNLLLRFST
jgi:hypothetical protein